MEERGEAVYDIGYGYGNPCRYLQEAFRSFLRCLGLEKQGEGKENTSSGVGGSDSGSGGGGGGEGGGDGDGDGDGGGGEVDDPPTTSPIMDPTDEPVFETGITRRRPPSRGPISSGGPGQTN